ncbi:MTH938/NDUFAF3 family protein [Rhizobiaceae bacterium]|nr:MTH938/NDUFAF3 family protein [Rhizobiaceae bacterium]
MADKVKADDLPNAALHLEAAHFPGRAALESYGNGGFRFAGMSHRGSILCLPSGVHAWSAESVTDFSAAAFAPVMDESGIEVLLVGTGANLVPLPASLVAALRDAGIRAEPMATGAAARTFNVLLSENRPVAAALLAVA